LKSPEIKIIFDILENFIKRKKLILYGGIAINNILPKKDQYYDKKYELPDYDIYSKNSINDAKELVDLYAFHGFKECEAKSAIHFLLILFQLLILLLYQKNYLMLLKENL